MTMATQKKYNLEYKGIQLATDLWTPLSDEEFAKAKEEYFAKPPVEEVLYQLKAVANGGTKINLIGRYYFRDLMAKVKLRYNKWTIEDVYNCKQLMEHLAAKIAGNAKVYPPEWSLHKKLYKCFSIAGKGVASPPTQFNIKDVDSVLSKYNVNGNWYDFSCGWGVRLMGALRNKVNYFGTDPNNVLCDRLASLERDWRSVSPSESTVDIRCQGSEVLVPEWVGKMGVAFSSPPYFDLEDYKIGEGQSYKEGMEYKDWCRNYVVPTLMNIYQYLVDGGYFVLNLKNPKIGQPLLDHWTEFAKRVGFKFVGQDVMKVKSRCFGKTNEVGAYNEHNGDEPMYVFQK